MFREGTALEALESVDSRRYGPYALAATLLTIVAPALVVVALSPLSGIADLLLSALLATGLSVAAGSAGAALWTRLPQSREIPFGDLMLWSFARRIRAERRLARTAACETPLGAGGDLAALRRLAVVFEARDGFNHGHSGRVARHAERIARRLRLSEREIEQIEAAAAVHDVGMVGVPRSVLAKRGDLNAEERELVQRHAVDGAERVAAVADPAVAALVRHRHERVDGSGYPDGLSGDEIPLGARIIAVADCFDELIAAAAQRSPRGRRNALDELAARSGSELDAAVVAAFGAYYSGTRSIAGVALAATAPQRAVRWIAAAPATIGSAGAPAVIQGVCAAGTTALATACLTGLPALDADRGDGQAPAKSRVTRSIGSDARDLASAVPAPAGFQGGAGERPEPRRRPDSGGDEPASRAPSGQVPVVPNGGSGGGGGDGQSAPDAPQAGDGGGGAIPPSGGEGGTGSAAQTPPAATTPVPPPPPVQAPQTPATPTAQQVLDPVLDGVGDTVPPVKPVTDAVKNLLGGLTGGGQAR